MSRFLHRHKKELVLKATTGIDRNRHKADSGVKYDRYFSFWHAKMEEYQIEPRQMYNMDEKGLLMGRTARTHRVFNRAMWDRGELRAAVQDGSREWITILASICADGTALDPGLIYSSDASTIQSSWVEEIDQKGVFITASTTGWSNNDLGVAWLREVFDRQTKAKARQSWRLLITDGHASHCSMEFIDYCDQNKILLAVFPSHSTHTLQPLDVVMFKPFSSAYTKELINFQLKSQGMLSMAKRDFFSLFWRAWESSFTKPLILKAFEATGLSPRNANVILKRFMANDSDSNPTSSDDSQTSLSGWFTINRRLKKVAKDEADGKTKQLAQAIHHLVCQNELLKHENKGLQEAVAAKEKRQARGKPFQPREEDLEHGGAAWWSPRSIRRQKHRLEEEDLDKQQKEQQKAADKDARRAARELKARLVAEGKAAREVMRRKKQREKAAAAALRIQRRNEAAVTKKTPNQD